ncbi:ABC transporter substrate-binding protein [Alkalibacterium sp.]|nr:MAG: ABC transporter substrate-binding protein [Alkalibacterium sp.]
MQKQKKWLQLGTGLLAVGALALGACDNGDSAESSGSTAETDTSSEDNEVIEETEEQEATENTETVEITFWHAMNGPHQDAITELTNRFNESQDEFYVNEQGQGGYAELSQSVMGAGVSGDLPTMSQLTASDVPDLASNGLLVELTDDFLVSNGMEQDTLDDIFDGFLMSSEYDGEKYAMPFSKSTRLMYYNQDILDEYGFDVPASWDEITALGEEMVAAADDRVAMGFENGFEMEYETIARQNGADFINRDTLTADIDSPESVEALEFINTMFEEGHARTAGEDGYFSGPFGRGEAALYIGSSAGIAHVQPVADENGLDWGTAEIPQFNGTPLTLFAGNDLALYASASEEEQRGYVAFMEFLLQPEHTAEWAMSTGYVPIRESALQDEDYLAFLEENPQQEAPNHMLEYGMASPTFVGYGQFRNALLDAMDDVAVSGMDPQTVLENLQVEAESIIESNN